MDRARRGPPPAADGRALSTPDDAALAARLLAYFGAAAEAAASEVRSAAGARVLRTRDLPLVWTLNQVHVPGPVTPADARSLADAEQGDLPYRHLVVDDDEAGKRLARALGDAWRAERDVLMVLSGPPRPVAGRGAVVEVGEDDMLALMRRWHAADFPGTSVEGLAQLDEFHRREARVTGERRFGASGDDGRPVALAKLRTDGEVASVDDVFTAPEARRRGLARRVVTHACARAHADGAPCVFLLADADDWPQHLYAEIGFRPVGQRWVLHRDAG